MRWRVEGVSVVVKEGVKEGCMGEVSVLSTVDMMTVWRGVGDGLLYVLVPSQVIMRLLRLL